MTGTVSHDDLITAIAAELGGTVKPRDGEHWYIILLDDGTDQKHDPALWLTFDRWNHKGKLNVSGCWPRDNDGHQYNGRDLVPYAERAAFKSDINVSPDKTPAQIARDIQRRHAVPMEGWPTMPTTPRTRIPKHGKPGTIIEARQITYWRVSYYCKDGRLNSRQVFRSHGVTNEDEARAYVARLYEAGLIG